MACLSGGTWGGVYSSSSSTLTGSVFGFKYLTAIQAFEIIDAIPAGDNLGTGVIASGRHIQRLAEVYFKRARALVKRYLYSTSAPGLKFHLMPPPSGQAKADRHVDLGSRLFLRLLT